MDAQGQVKVLDFSIAKLLGDETQTATMHLLQAHDAPAARVALAQATTRINAAADASPLLRAQLALLRPVRS